VNNRFMILLAAASALTTASFAAMADGPTRDVLLARSKDRKMEAGLYDAGPSEQDIDSDPEDEFMFFIDGAVKLTSADGTVLEVHAGEGAAIPKGWKGHWSTQGYKKYYVTYASGKAPK
jgi:uncharacterized cupin superfamily protein